MKMMSKHKVAPFDSTTPLNGSQKIRRKVQEIIDGKLFAAFMGVITVWVLFGDDLRLLLTSKSADTAFFATFFLCLVLFIIEIIMNSIFLPDYKFTFFFWLDVVATISLVPDIPTILDPFLNLFEVDLYKVNVDYTTSVIRNTLSESYVTRGIQTIRYIRLVRIVKLYKYFTKKKSEDYNNQTASNSMDAEVLGKTLSDITTRRVIIGVLLLLLILPLLQVQTVDNAKYYGLQQLYWIGSSAFMTDLSDENIGQYMSTAGWNYSVVRYSLNSETSEGSGSRYPLLWLSVPSLANNGEVTDITEATDPITGNIWTSDQHCIGKTVGSDCNLRSEEMTVVAYGPVNCNQTGCTEVKAYARFNIQYTTQNQAVMSIVITCFVGVILAVASCLFALDTQRIVIKPVNKMVSVIRGLAKNPLKIGEEETLTQPKESILEETIDKIGILLRINFGTRGSGIMNDLLANDMPFKSDKIKGIKQYCIIVYITIQDSAQIIDSLQEEVLVFINKIAKIVHSCANRWEGHVCRNDMSGFLMLWDENKACEALVAMIKTYAELHRANDIMAYKSNPKIVTRFQNNNYMVDLQIAAHIGEIIEGPVGSNIKIMPDYIGPSINLAKRVQVLNSLYETNVLLTDSFFNTLPPQAQKGCRKIDNVLLTGHFEPIELYTFDVSEVNLPDVKRLNMNDEEFKIDNRKPGDPVYDGGYDFKDYEAQDLFGTDNDIVTMIKTGSVIDHKFSQGVENYLNGSWNEANKIFDLVLEDRPAYGPVKALKKFMDGYNQKAPEGWQGVRSLY